MEEASTRRHAIPNQVSLLPEDHRQKSTLVGEGYLERRVWGNLRTLLVRTKMDRHIGGSYGRSGNLYVVS